MRAVRNVSFEIKRGETLAVVGESGSGKSVTALSILQLLPYPMANHPNGSIRFQGRELVGAPPRELLDVRGNRISMIFQEPMTSLNPLHTIERQVNEVLILHKGLTRSAARKRTLELLEQVGIPEAANRLDAFPHQLSGGQRQRVMIAMALANEPDLLIADEPTTALDVTIQAQILKLLKTLQARYGMALLFITHDLGIVRKMADRVCVMTKGRIVEQGPVAEVFDNPQHSYTQHLLSAEPKGRPVEADPAAAEILKLDDVKVHFPIKRGVLRRTVGYIKAVDGVSLTLREGHTIGLVGESGSGKTTLGLALLRLEGSKGGIQFDKQDLQALSQREIRPLAPPDADRLPGSLQLAQPAHVGGRDRRRRPAGAQDRQRGRAQPHDRPGADRGRARSGGARALSARILRRPAPAHRHRPRPGAEAPPDRARRADLGARHERAGADRRPAARPANAATSSPTCSSAMTSRSCARWPTRSWCCATARWWSAALPSRSSSGRRRPIPRP